jgi:hypothetical protein
MWAQRCRRIAEWMAPHTNMLHGVVTVHLRPVLTFHVHSMGQTGFEHIHARKMVLPWGVKTVHRSMQQPLLWIVRYVSGPHNMLDYPCDYTSTFGLSITGLLLKFKQHHKKNYKSINEKWQYANSILKLQWIKCLYSISYPFLQQFHLTFHQQ